MFSHNSYCKGLSTLRSKVKIFLRPPSTLHNSKLLTLHHAPEVKLIINVEKYEIKKQPSSSKEVQQLP